MLGPVFVGGADDLHRGHEAVLGLGVEDPYLVRVLVGQVRDDDQGRPWRGPHRGRDCAFRRPRFPLLRSLAGPAFFKGGYVDFKIGPQVSGAARRRTGAAIS